MIQTDTDAVVIGIVIVDGTALVDGVERHQETVIDIGVIVIEIVHKAVGATRIWWVSAETKVIAAKTTGKDGDVDQDIEKYCKIIN